MAGGFLGTLMGGGSSFNPIIGGAGGLFNTSYGQGQDLFGQGQAAQNELNPYFTNLLKNPQGLGATTMSQLMTQAGQNTAGAVGADRTRAMGLGARTGNMASIPGAIGAADKSGMNQMSGVQNNLAIKNVMEKLNQQKEGAEGLSGLLGKDISGAEGFEGLADKALGTEDTALNQKNQANQVGLSRMMSMASAAAGGIPGMGGSSGFLSKLFSSGEGDD